MGEAETKNGGVVATVVAVTKPIEKPKMLKDRLYGYKQLNP